mmetsp:Transcript_39417/g.101032  ORF Transcript_39417/g.101032 Transcript_39417/m.101032 type:complete len:83 (+) Transcript_39417:166-414(+)
MTKRVLAGEGASMMEAAAAVVTLVEEGEVDLVEEMGERDGAISSMRTGVMREHLEGDEVGSNRGEVSSRGFHLALEEGEEEG